MISQVRFDIFNCLKARDGFTLAVQVVLSDIVCQLVMIKW